MRSKIILCLKTAWVVAALMLLLVGTSVCAAADHACFVVSNMMLFFMFLLTFPIGPVLLLGSIILLEFPGDSSTFVVPWFIMACGGFCQWFIVAPRLFANPGFTVLDLNLATTSQQVFEPQTASQPAVGNVEHRNAPPINFVAPAVSRRPSRNRIQPFDRLGRTPLERVINRL